VSWLRQHIVDDWHQALKWSSVRINLAVVALSTLAQVMPALDPQIANMLPEALRNPAIGIYAMMVLALRLTKLKANG
jgi:hypothetical protein